jgi:tRNA1Val (adenine37-N6)-methyltransferase
MNVDNDRLLQLKRDGETADILLSGRLTVFQKATGYRFSIDALLLSHFVRLRKGHRVVDIGTGSGVIALVLACRFPDARITGVEIQKELVDMARRSIEVNRLAGRVEIREGDITKIRADFPPDSFDVAVFNPPYRKLNSGRVNPDPERAIARHEIKGSLGDFMESARVLLKDGGTVYAIYPAKRGTELLFQMRRATLEPKRLRMVHSRLASDGEFILVEGVKRGGEELVIMPPLFIYGDGQGYSREMECIFSEIACPDGFGD